MVDSPSKRATYAQSSSYCRRTYVDATSESESEAEDAKQLRSSHNDNVGSKRKRVTSFHSSSTTTAHKQVESTSSESELELGEEEYEIDSIVDSRIRKFRGKAVLEYRVHWKGYDTDEDSWTTADQFDDDDPPVLEFFKKYPKKPSVANLGKNVKAAPKEASPTSIRDVSSSPAPPSPKKKASPPPPSKKKEAAPPPHSRKKEPSVTIVDSPVRKIPSSPTAKKSTDIRSFFGALLGGANKENRNPVVPKEVKEKALKGKGKEKEKPVVKAETVKPERKKRKVQSEDEDFEMAEEKDEPEDDLESDFDEGDDKAESAGDDLESEHESGESVQEVPVHRANKKLMRNRLMQRRGTMEDGEEQRPKWSTRRRWSVCKLSCSHFPWQTAEHQWFFQIRHQASWYEERDPTCYQES